MTFLFRVEVHDGHGAWPQAAEQRIQMREHLNAEQKYLEAHLIHLGE